MPDVLEGTAGTRGMEILGLATFPAGLSTTVDRFGTIAAVEEIFRSRLPDLTSLTSESRWASVVPSEVLRGAWEDARSRAARKRDVSQEMSKESFEKTKTRQKHTR